MAQPDVMNLIQKERSPNAPRMSTQDIVRTSLERQGMGDQFEDIYGRLQSAVDTPNYRIMRSGNTLLFYQITKPKEEVMFDIITADTPQSLPSSLKEIMDAMKKAGFKRGMAMTENTNLVNIAQAAGIPVQVKMGERMVGNQMMPTQQVIVELQ